MSAPFDGSPAKRPAGAAEIRAGTAEWLANRPAELIAQAEFLERGGAHEAAAILRREAADISSLAARAG